MTTSHCSDRDIVIDLAVGLSYYLTKPVPGACAVCLNGVKVCFLTLLYVSEQSSDLANAFASIPSLPR